MTNYYLMSPMETYCTRPDCSQPINNFSELDDRSQLQTTPQKYCHSCGMPQILAGRYIPQKLLGKGGFGAAYLACDRHTTQLRQCVVKQFQPSNNFDEKTLKIAEALFTREAEVLETLGNEHPQIPDLYAFFPLIVPQNGAEEKQFFYIVQEYIDGETLAQEVAQKGKLSEAEVRDILENMLQILQFVHEHHSIHRDIKPSNMMRDREGKLYLLDFGAVKRVAMVSSSDYSTGIYSMGFAPPEQMQGRQVYPSTDLYALAASCVRLVTGKPIQDLYDSYQNQWTWRQEAEISDQLAALLDRMLLPTPKERLASAEAVLKALQNHSTAANIPEDAVFNQSQESRSLLSLATPDANNPTPTNVAASQQDFSSESEQFQELSAHPIEEPTVVQSQGERNPSPVTSVQAASSQPEEVQGKTKPVQFTLWELLASAGFTGLEGALLLIALTGLFSIPSISIGLWGMSMGALIYAQWQRLIEKFDFFLIGGITLAVVVLLSPLHQMPIAIVIFLAISTSAGAVSFTAIIRLLYKLLSK